MRAVGSSGHRIASGRVDRLLGGRHRTGRAYNCLGSRPHRDWIDSVAGVVSCLATALVGVCGDDSAVVASVSS